MFQDSIKLNGKIVQLHTLVTCDNGSLESESIVNDDVAVYGVKVQLRSMKNRNP